MRGWIRGGDTQSRSEFVRQRAWKRKAATDYVTRRRFSEFEIDAIVTVYSLPLGG
jgi:hypothetical protein